MLFQLFDYLHNLMKPNQVRFEAPLELSPAGKVSFVLINDNLVNSFFLPAVYLVKLGLDTNACCEHGELNLPHFRVVKRNFMCNKFVCVAN